MKKRRSSGYGCIYLLQNLKKRRLKNGRFAKGRSYVGYDKTGDPENHRWHGHIKAAFDRKDPRPLYCAMRKSWREFGHLNFSAEVIWRGPIEKLCVKEVYYIAKLHTWFYDQQGGGYNLTFGGDGFSGKHSTYSKKKTGLSSKRAWADPVKRKALLRGCQLRWDQATPEWRAAFSEAQSCAWKNPVRREKTRAALRLAWARKTPKERRAIGAAISAGHAKRTPAEQEAYRESHRLGALNRYAKMSPEERSAEWHATHPNGNGSKPRKQRRS